MTTRFRRLATIGIVMATIGSLTACIPMFDFNKDLRADRIWISRDTGAWHREGTSTALFTQPLDVAVNGSYPSPVAADYDGNGTLDAAYVLGDTWTYRNTVGVLDASAGLPTDSTDHVLTMTLPAKNSASDILIPVPADYNGDGNADPAWYRLSDATWFIKDQAPVQFGLGKASASGWQDVPVPADYDGDGDADIATYRPGDATWRVRGKAAVVQLGTKGNYPVPGDWNRDGKAEMAVYGFDRAHPSLTARWLIAGEASPRVAPATAGDLPVPADYTGDGKFDTGYFDPTTGVWTMEAGAPGSSLQLRPNFVDMPAIMPTSLVASIVQLTFLDKCAISLQRGDATPSCPATPEPRTCTTITISTLCEGGTDWDFTGDGKADRVWFERATGKWFLDGVATPIAQTPPDTAGSPAITSQRYAPADYDGDGVWEIGYLGDDPTQWVTSGARGTINFPLPPQPGPPIPARTWPNSGGWILKMVPADYDGDGDADPAWYLESSGTWYIQGRAPVQFGLGFTSAEGWHDIPVPADYDGDGDADIAVYRPGDGTFRIQGVTDPIDVGSMGNTPVPADYDGDGKVDPATYGFNRAAGLGYPSWTIRRSSTGATTSTPQTNPLSPYPAVADYDGDGSADLSLISDTGSWWASTKPTNLALPVQSGTIGIGLPANWYPTVITEVVRLTFLDKCGIALNPAGFPGSNYNPATYCPPGPMPS